MAARPWLRLEELSLEEKSEQALGLEGWRLLFPEKLWSSVHSSVLQFHLEE